MILKRFSAVLAAAVVSMSLLSFPVYGKDSSDNSATEPKAVEDADTDTDKDSDDKEPEAEREYSVFEAIKIRRDILNKGNNYSLSDYIDVYTFIINTSKKSIRSFYVSYDTQGYDTSNYTDLKVLDPKEVSYKRNVPLAMCALIREGYVHSGWEYEGEVYSSSNPLRMPSHDVVMTPVWKKRVNITYYAGDYDDIVGNKTMTVTLTENTVHDTGDSSRFSRMGYTITGWKCSYDDKVYGTLSSLTVPTEDITLEAVWTPAKYSVSISAGNGKVKDKITASAVCGEEFVLPECEFQNEGKTFAGWNYNGTIYQPGESFVVAPMLSGSKIVIVGTWE